MANYTNIEERVAARRDWALTRALINHTSTATDCRFIYTRSERRMGARALILFIFAIAMVVLGIVALG